jgi:hypothetical protein
VNLGPRVSGNLGLYALALGVVVVGVNVISGWNAQTGMFLAVVLVIGVAISQDAFSERIAQFSQTLSQAFRG